MNYMKIDNASVNDGIGVRVVLYVSGCDIQCKGCHNPETHDINAGICFDYDSQIELFKAIDKPYITGLTLSGGHPLHPENIESIKELLSLFKERFPEKNVWLYTGYTWEEIHKKKLSYILKFIDVLVDGPFIEELKDTSLSFRGSTNQRIIDVTESLRKHKIITMKIEEN